jgi:hypothetical protein
MTKLTMKRVIKANPMQGWHQKQQKSHIWIGDVFEVRIDGEYMGLAKTVAHKGTGAGWLYEVCINGKVIRSDRKRLIGHFAGVVA